ncbi:hypothetical protein JTE90_029024 [Oedothorax gibbosus]|uniref:Uncharacterized protein n=1 Tax=Oedothorax gibbosus TaxID=931172 RepID=A0AAV6UIF7_9ARAC|nr:hypothetical protein JTE90_029024 [Oedothorax gibbosus]
MTAPRALCVVAFVWLYAAVFSFTPILLPINRYVPERFLTSCSFDSEEPCPGFLPGSLLCPRVGAVLFLHVYDTYVIHVHDSRNHLLDSQLHRQPCPSSADNFIDSLVLHLQTTSSTALSFICSTTSSTALSFICSNHDTLSHRISSTALSFSADSSNFLLCHFMTALSFICRNFIDSLVLHLQTNSLTALSFICIQLHRSLVLHLQTTSSTALSFICSQLHDSLVFHLHTTSSTALSFICRLKLHRTACPSSAEQTSSTALSFICETHFFRQPCPSSSGHFIDSLVLHLQTTLLAALFFIFK